MSALRYDGLVVLITGSGSGLGKEYALAFANRGASVIVNDLGGNVDGIGKSGRPADVVVEEIRRNGGKAVANYDSVEDGKKLIDSALNAFGKIDIVINNAGILRDKSFSRISDEDWDIIHRVHLRGSFLVTRAAWDLMKKQKFGRVIFTSSTSALYGNFGQANYSSAKLGLLGLSNTLAVEGKKYNIHCNTIAPTAGSRLTATVMPPDLLEALKPEYIAPLVLWLSHPSCTESGSVFEVGAGWAAKLRWQQAQGAVLRRKGLPMTPEAVRDSFDTITDFSKDPNYRTVMHESTMNLVDVLSKVEKSTAENVLHADTGSETFNLERARARRYSDVTFSYTEKDILLYNLCVGVRTTDDDFLSKLYEGASQLFPLPSYVVIPAQQSLGSLFVEGVSGLELDMTRLLHGEQYTELFKPLPSSGSLISRVRLQDVLDKGKGVLVIVDVETFDSSGKEKIAFNQFSFFFLNASIPGLSKTSIHPIYKTEEIPKRAPDTVAQMTTSTEQAAFYRLTGDFNPIHIDPSMAALVGMKTPILHGLCTYGISARAILKTYFGGDTVSFKSLKARFSKPVIPGQTVLVEMWKEGNRVLFQTKVRETGEICISGGYMEFSGNVSSSPKEKSINVSKPLQNVQEPKSNALFLKMKEVVEAKGGLKPLGHIYLFSITDGKNVLADWYIDVVTSPGCVVKLNGDKPKKPPTCTIIISDDNFVDLSLGKLVPQKAFFSGKLKVKGNVLAAQKLSNLINTFASKANL